jgi:hypothetical protein
MAGLELFYWHRAEGGYEWQDAKALNVNKDLPEDVAEETRFLVPKPMETPRHWRYNPLVTYPALFREFAALERKEDAFAAFASKYGELGVGVWIERSGPLSIYDPYFRWAKAHRKMKPVSEVLDAIQRRDVDTLRHWFSFASGERGGVQYQRKSGDHIEALAWVTIAGQLRDYLWKWITEAPTDDEALIRAAQGWAQMEINEAIRNENGEATSSIASVVFDIDKGAMTLHVTPRSLLGAMWLQCARALTSNPTFRQCEHCGKWFEVSPDARRKNSKYCEGRCKVAAYRSRTKAVSAR